MLLDDDVRQALRALRIAYAYRASLGRWAVHSMRNLPWRFGLVGDEL